RVLGRIAEIDAAAGGRDPDVRGQLLFFRALILMWLGDDPYAAWSAARASAAHLQLIGDRRYGAVSLMAAGEGARRLYSLEEGARGLRAGLAAARELGEIITVDLHGQVLVRLLAEHGTAAELDEARPLAAGPADRPPGMYRGLGLVSLSLLALRDGDPTAAEAHARAAEATVRSRGQHTVLQHVYVALLRALIARGAPEAGATADEALAFLDEHGPMGHLDLPLRLAIARAHLAVGRREDAARGIGRAIEKLERQAAKIPDEAMRESFRERVPENAAIRVLARELGAG